MYIPIEVGTVVVVVVVGTYQNTLIAIVTCSLLVLVRPKFIEMINPTVLVQLLQHS